MEITATANADGGTKQTVTQGNNGSKEDSTPVITSGNNETKNTATINAGAEATANVTIRDTNIKIDSNTKKAAVNITGAGDVNLNIEGTNAVNGGKNHAAVEKNNESSLTIGSESGEGQLTANGGSK